MLKYLSYVSEQSHSINQYAIDQLLKKSRKNNETGDITGILIYFEGVFTQFLEGPEQEVNTLYKKITNDKRHHNLRELFSGNSTERFYGDWSMAYKTVDIAEAQEIIGYRPFDKSKFFEPVRGNKEHPGVLLLESFVEGLHFF